MEKPPSGKTKNIAPGLLSKEEEYMLVTATILGRGKAKHANAWALDLCPHWDIPFFICTLIRKGVGGLLKAGAVSEKKREKENVLENYWS